MKYTRLYGVNHKRTEGQFQITWTELQQSLPKSRAAYTDINTDSGFLDMIQMILEHGQQQGDVRRDLALEKLTRYVTMLYISHVSEMLNRKESLLCQQKTTRPHIANSSRKS